MLKEKAGALAGQIWEALNGTGLGWLLREDKVVTSEVEGEIFVKLV